MRAPKPLFILGCFGFTAILVAPFFGAETLSLSAVFYPQSPEYRILTDLRLPRLLLAALVGGCLSTLGAIYQIIFHNSLSEPYVLGVSSGATLAIVTGELAFGIGALSIAGGVCGLAGGMIVAGLIIFHASLRSQERPEHLILFGVGINFVLSSILFILLSFQLQSSSSNFRFLFGQIAWVSWAEVGWVWLMVFPVLIVLWIFGRKLDALSFGDEVARTLGVRPELTRNLLIFLTSILVSLLVIFAGSIGFVGLAVPHVVRLWVKPQSSRQLMHHCFLFGAVFLVISDVVSRTLLPPFEFPIGTITTLVGGPVFLYFLWKR